MQTLENKLRSVIRDILREIIEEYSDITEINTTANIDGYQTPHAFSGDDDDEESHTKKIKSRAEVFDFKSIKNKKENTVSISEGKSLFHLYRDSSDYTSEQKLGITVREINKLLSEIDKLATVSSRFKLEKNVNNEKMWKTTNRYLMKLDEKIKRISTKIKELR
jgi:hypothetical protein